MAGSRGLWQNANDSKSMWNYTLSPGWTHRDVEVLRMAVMKYGCGNWVKITKHFPNKTCGQLNLQTQRLFGQQSLAEFFRLHIDPKIIKTENDKIESVLRKNGCIINTGDNMTVEARKGKRIENKKFELSKDKYQNIKVPIVYDEIKCTSIQTKIKKLSKLYRCLFAMEQRYSKLDSKPDSKSDSFGLSQRITDECNKAKPTKTAVRLTKNDPSSESSSDVKATEPPTDTGADVTNDKKPAKKPTKKRKKMDSKPDDDEYMPTSKRQRTKK